MSLKILTVHYPLIEDPTKTKLRPALQLNEKVNDKNQCQIAFITSSNKYTNYNDILIEAAHLEFSKTKLSKTSTIRLSKIATVEPSQIKGFIGILPSDLEQEVKKALITQFNLKK